jgi:hypothetical protein
MVRRDYIFDLLQKQGSPSRLRNWITALLITSSSRILLNGVAGVPIKPGRGLRQGDHLSPLPFVLVIDPLTKILDIATFNGLLHKIRGRGSTKSNIDRVPQVLGADHHIFSPRSDVLKVTRHRQRNDPTMI